MHNVISCWTNQKFVPQRYFIGHKAERERERERKREREEGERRKERERLIQYILDFPIDVPFGKTKIQLNNILFPNFHFSKIKIR